MFTPYRLNYHYMGPGNPPVNAVNNVLHTQPIGALQSWEANNHCRWLCYYYGVTAELTLTVAQPAKSNLDM